MFIFSGHLFAHLLRMQMPADNRDDARELANPRRLSASRLVGKI